MSLAEELKSACPAFAVQEPMSRHTSLAVGGPADFYAEAGSLSELIALHEICRRHSLPVFFLGSGSNVLVSDQGIRGLVLRLQGEFRRVEFDGERVTVGAGAFMPRVAKLAAEHGLAGIESLIGVPGTIGGGLVMNAGTREGWIGQVVQSVTVLSDSGEVLVREAKDLEFSYRHSNLAGRWVVSAELLLKREDSATIMKRIDTLLQYRSRTQPLATSNCGSVFKNPPEGPAAQWIEKAGFKGVAIGGARVSERHANFIINEKNATAGDVDELMRRIQAKVFEQFQVKLEPEVKRVGDWA